MSRAASMTDMRPNRGAMMIQILQLFVREFFDQNPLSHLSIMMLRNGRAERLTELSGSPVSSIVNNLSMTVHNGSKPKSLSDSWYDMHHTKGLLSVPHIIDKGRHP